MNIEEKKELIDNATYYELEKIWFNDGNYITGEFPDEKFFDSEEIMDYYKDQIKKKEFIGEHGSTREEEAAGRQRMTVLRILLAYAGGGKTKATTLKQEALDLSCPCCCEPMEKPEIIGMEENRFTREDGSFEHGVQIQCNKCNTVGIYPIRDL